LDVVLHEEYVGVRLEAVKCVKSRDVLQDVAVMALMNLLVNLQKD